MTEREARVVGAANQRATGTQRAESGKLVPQPSRSVTADPRFEVCKACRYHMRPDQLVGGLCVNKARCDYRIRERLRHKAAVGKGRR